MVHPLFWEISLLFNLQRQEVQVLHDGKILKEGHALVGKDTNYQQDFSQIKKSKANSKIQHLCTFAGNLMWLSDRNKGCIFYGLSFRQCCLQLVESEQNYAILEGLVKKCSILSLQ